MRIAGGIVSLVLLAALSGCTGGTDGTSDGAPPAQGALRSDASPISADPDLAALESEVAKLEAELALLPALVRSDDLATLHARLDASDGPGMYAIMVRILNAGEPGFRVLHDFFHECDVPDQRRILKLTHDPPMLFAMLRATALYPDRVAELSDFLMRATRDRPASFIRREIFNFVPVFLKHHDGRYPELGEKLRREIDFQLEHGGAYVQKVMMAIRDLDYEPPIEALSATLRAPHEPASRSTILDALAGRAGGVDAIVEYIDSAEKVDEAVIYALRLIAQVDLFRGTERFPPFLEHIDPVVRTSAFVQYFQLPRGPDSFQRALTFLNDPGSVRAKLQVLGAIRQQSPDLFLVLREENAAIVDAEAREALIQMRPLSIRSATSGGEGGSR